MVWQKNTFEGQKGSLTITGAPRVFKGKVIIGNGGAEYGVRGYITAYDAESGEHKSRWFSVPGDPSQPFEDESMRRAAKTWDPSGKWWEAGGGGTMWDSITFDADLNTMYVGTGNGSPWSHKLRSPKGGDNLYLASIVALDPDTGKYKWHYQETPGDNWDYTSTQPMILADLRIDGKPRKVILHAPKNGFFFVLDRTNGKFIRGFPFVDKITWAKGLDKDGRPIFNEDNRPGSPTEAGAQGKSVFVAPSFLGGKNWMPMAYSQDTGLFYVPSNEWGMDIWNEGTAYKKGAAYLGAGFTIHPLNDDYIGVLRAIDPKTGKEVWRYKNYAPLWGGVLATKGNLVFTGNPEGYLMAFDAKTGKKLYEFQTGSGVIGSPITWEMDGEQYVSVLSGWGGAVPLWGGEVAKRIKDFNQGGMLWTFKLPKEVAAVAHK